MLVNRRIAFSFAMLLGLTSNLSLADYDRDPVGEEAAFTVEKIASRTSNMIRSGNLVTTVSSFDPDHADGPMYRLNIDWTLRIQLIGNRSGVKMVDIPESYFSAEFLEELRETGEYSGPTFKAKHLGYANVRNMNGAVYNNCDKIMMYDLKEVDSNGLMSVSDQLSPKEKDSLPFSEEIEDMVIVAHVKEGIPGLGAVKLDVSGKYQGRDVKAGADLD